MIVIRACKEKYAKKLDGAGAEKSGGRWNLIGTPVNYTADSKDTVRAEIKHQGYDPIKLKFVFVHIEVSDNLEILEITPDLLKGIPWDMDNYEDSDCPSPEIGSELLQLKEFAIIKVPSTRSSGYNYLLNPEFEDFDKFIKIVKVESFYW